MPANKPKAITLIGHWPDYEVAFFNSSNSDAYDIRVIDPLQQLAASFPPKLIFKPLRTWLIKRLTRRIIRQHSDSIIVMHESRSLIEAVDTMADKHNVNIMMRNIYDPGGKTARCLQSLMAKAYTVWSFDGQDCAQYGFKAYNQFAEKIGEFEQTPISHDFCFFGRDKGRRATLEGIKAAAAKAGLSCYLAIKDASKKDKANANSSYATYLQHLCGAQCIIDIVQDGQSGSTLRPLEAALYRRKLLTNNQAVKALAIYEPNNVLCFDRLEEIRPEVLRNFMAQPLVEIEPARLQPYSLSDFLDKLPANT